MKKLIVLCLLLSSCAAVPFKQQECEALVKAQDDRYVVCQEQVNECVNVLKKDHPDLLSKIMYGVIGLSVGLTLGARFSH